ncbi:signal peptide peptidase SppA [Shewanella sedimentimangrovi]|uniref:Signal peptide peptidase SppA n=1 Tax=Shewanella sedimentimangrovi TaxID=2814293 RepID=A0ABX7QVN2_9GAMM|nr:signal peptide peptidase SppA [Shewanella sedimentimangrovi]QSX35581.1 signal peptide peptidase SppA [Shewanella sedimentimangrovi]
MARKPLTTRNTLALIWNTINFVRKLIINLVFFPVFLLLFIGVIIALSSSEETRVEPGSALVLDLNGTLVDQARPVDPIESLLMQNKRDREDAEVLLSELLYVIENASHDDRISTIVLDLANLHGGGISKLEAVGTALNKFKEAGKSVVAIGDWYGQGEYLLASYADTIYLNPQGMVSLDGFASYRMFFKSALEKLKIKTHVFRVGTYKSAVEPFIRDDMSKEAKEASGALLGDIWQSFADTVSHNRGIPAENLVLDGDTYLAKLEAAEGDSAKLALDMGWVDALASAEEFRVAMVDKVGKAKEGNGFLAIHYDEYAKLVAPSPSFAPMDSVAIVVAKGTILNGYQAPGDIGGESTSELLRKARFNKQVKALVLRVDSPGGSAFASEQIRQELLALQAAGKPVVVSMGSMAASGGYWISASADYIYATPTTLTGSIGIFGMITTFEDSLASLGIHTDGVATSEWAGMSATRSLSPKLEAVIQRHIERGYHEFISLVAKERNMTLEQVDSIAQGRVWSGKKALELGLVDAMGDMDEAIAKAAELASLDTFDTELIEQELTPEQKFIQEMFAHVAAWMPISVRQSTPLEQMLGQLSGAVAEIAAFDDPNHVYLYCELCSQ